MDATVIKDKQNLPYVPGKTIKGLIREALSEMQEVNDDISPKEIGSILGVEKREESEPDKVIITEAGAAFFSNAELPEVEKQEVVQELSDFLYRNIASTQIQKGTGVAKPNSLRILEVCIPLTLEGEITGIKNSDQYLLLTNALKWIRHLGVNRNRGLGRCKFEVEPETE